MEILFFSTQSQFRKWLENNHTEKKEVFVGFYKLHTKKTSMTWSQSVDQALCFGWIDGIKKRIDDDSYWIRFTPRKKSSIWSAINIDKVQKLNKLGLMTTEGLKIFSQRTENRSKIYAHENKKIKLDLKYEDIFKKNKLAWDFFDKQPPSYKRTIIHWIMSAKQIKTKLSRLEKIIEQSEKHKRI